MRIGLDLLLMILKNFSFVVISLLHTVNVQ